MKLTYAVATVPVLASVADARYTAFQHGYSPCASASITRSPTTLDMRRRMGGCSPGPRSIFSEMEAEMEQMQRQMRRRRRSFSPFDDFFDSPMLMRPSTPFLTSRADLMLPDLAPARRRTYRYNIAEDEDKFTLTVDLPGIKASDMKVSLEQDGRVLRLSGVQTTKNGDMSYESKFDKAFVLDKSVDVEAINAKLAEGVMTIEAPKKPKEEPKTVEIPILEEAPQQLEVTNEETITNDSTEQPLETDEVEMKVDAPAASAIEEEVVDLDKNMQQEKPKEMENAVEEEDSEEPPARDDLAEDGDILI